VAGVTIVSIASIAGMPDDRPLVWLPFDPALLGDPPDGLRYEVVDPTAEVPASVGDVELYVPPYLVTGAVADVLPRMTRLRVVQTLTAGVDNLRALVPEGVTLCNGRGIHDTSTAELAVTLVLASLRGVPGFVRAQDRGAWDFEWRPALADRRVLLVGYGAVGAAVEARLTPFEVDVVRVARTKRDGVHGFDELAGLLPGADVVILVVPLTAETRGLVDAGFLGRMKDGALLVNLARGPVVVTDDLVAELGTGRISAAIDVVDPEPLPAGHPLWSAPNLLVSPHVGGASSAMWPRAYRLVRDQLHRFAAGEPLANVMAGEY
jgi:phosphoglycerate dehydrogenase-like enzyme